MAVPDECGLLGRGPWEQMVSGPRVSQWRPESLGEAEARDKEVRIVKIRVLDKCISTLRPEGDGKRRRRDEVEGQSLCKVFGGLGRLWRWKDGLK